MEQESLEKIAQRYRDEGYDVVVEPRGEQTPSFLSDFRVDMIAKRGNESIIVEVKTNRIDLSNDPHITSLAEIVNAQANWKLDVVVLEAETAFEKAAHEAYEPSDEELAQILKVAEDLADQGYTTHAYVVAWGGIEAAMRRIQKGAELYGKSTPIELMRTLYGNGFLDKEQFTRLRDSYKIRSQVVHGLVPIQVDPGLVKYMTATARFLAYDTQDVVPSN